MLKINEELCIGCGACEYQCAFGAIEVVDGIAQVGDSCTLCGACVEECGLEALSIDTSAAKVKTDLDSWSGVLVFCEFRNSTLASVALELLGAGKRLADVRDVQLSALLVGHDTGDWADTLIGYGADIVYRIDHADFASFSEDRYEKIVTRVIAERRPEIVLAGATAIGRSFIPGVATNLNAGLTADCTALAIREEDGALLQTRPAFGGNIMATIECPRSRPQMATVRPKVMKENEFDCSRVGKIIDVEPLAEELKSCIRVVESVVAEQENVNIQESDILVSGGRGLGGPEGFETLKELAEVLDASISATRAVVDAGWITYPHQVGQTGKTVAPKLYIACGISGAIQHVAGMQSAETIVAINRDENAPIFDVADFGIVGDIKEVVPKLVKRLEARQKS